VDDLLAASGGGALVLAGEPGIGKTSLLAVARQRAQQAGFRVLAAVGSQAAVDLPFRGLRDLLVGLLDRAERLPDVQREALLTALGEQRGSAAQPFLVALATLDLLVEAAAEAPLLLCLDDMQWLDQPSADALAFVARRLGYDPIVMLATWRTHAGERPLPADLPRLDLGGLDESDARAVVREKLTAPDAVAEEQTLLAACGNPLALVELSAVRGAAGTSGEDTSANGPPLTERLESAFVGRLRDLPAATRDAVLIAAVDPIGDLAEILAAASRLGGHQVTADDLERAAQTGLVRYDEQQVGFRHPLVRSGVLQAVRPERLRAAHAALADLLRGDPYRRTWHRALALDAPDEQVAAQLEEEHRIPMLRGSVLAAIQMLERAAALSPRSADAGRRLMLAAELAFGLGNTGAVRRLLAAVDRTELPELEQARMRWLEEIFEDGVPGDPAPVLSLCAAAERSAAADDRSLALNLVLGAALRSFWADPGEQVRARVVAVTRTLDGSQDDPRYVAAIAIADPVREAAAVRRLLVDALETPSPNADPAGLRLLGMAAHAVGEQALTAEFMDRAEQRLRAQGRLGLLPHVLAIQIQARLDLGDWRRAAQAAEEGHRLAVDTGQPVWTAGSLVGDARVAAMHGDADTALATVAEVEVLCRPRGVVDLLACAQLVRGIALCTQERFEEAFEALILVFDFEGPCGHQRESFGAVALLAVAAVRSDRRAQARAVLEAAERGYGPDPATLVRTNLHYAHALLAEDEDAGPFFERAFAEDLSRWPWPRARLELAYGSWLRRRRRDSESRAPLRAALSTFEVIGARLWADQARAELRASGERDLGRAANAVSDLSPQELQIAQLAASGLSNRQIGEQLFLSPRTIGSHLYRIFPKLGVTSRVQLAAVLEGM
jgi:DNA-binding CsgD family transcriptional regulator